MACYPFIFEWSNIGQGVDINATFNVNSNTPGIFSINPSKIYYYINNNKKIFNSSCNASIITIRYELVSPANPKNIYSISGDGVIRIKWDTNREADFSRYDIYKSLDSVSYQQIASTQVASFDDVSIQDNFTYYYKIKAVDTSGNESEFSVPTAETYQNIKIRTYDTSGATVAAVGDINGDKRADLVLGYPLAARKNKQEVGKVAIFYGGNTSSTPDVILYGEKEYDKFGYSLAVVDMNNDGYSELIVGDPSYSSLDNYRTAQPSIGKVYVYDGGSNFNTEPALTIIGEWNYNEFYNGYYFDHLGFSIAPAGDINGDGYQDVLIGAPYGAPYAPYGADYDLELAGKVEILLGGAYLSASRLSVFGQHSGDRIGYSVSSSGDINHDGYDDFVTGGVNIYGSSGKAYLFNGTPNNPSLSFIFQKQETGFGKAVSHMDITGDGFEDICIASDSGIDIHYGNTPLTNSSNIRLAGNSEFISSIGDLNCDGFNDIITGPGPKIYFGGNSENVADIVRSDAVVIGTGDIDGDGINEIIVSDSMRVYIYSVLSYLTLPKIIITSPQDNTVTRSSEITISGLIKGNVAKFLVGGQQISFTPNGQWTANVSLIEGNNIFEIIAVTSDGKINKRILSLKRSQSLPLAVAITSPVNGSVVNDTPIQVSGTVNDSTARVNVNGVQGIVSGNTFIATGINIKEGLNTITAVATDNKGQIASNSITITLLTKGTITGTVKDSTSNLPLPDTIVTVLDVFKTITTTTDSNGVFSITGVTQGNFTARFEKSGYISQTVNGTVSAGQTLTLNIRLTQVPPLHITITSPQDGAVLNASPISVTGNVNNNAEVIVKGVRASVSNNIFSASIPLVEGQNLITALATDEYGQTASHSITVTYSISPIINNITVTNITTNLVTITWTTNQPTSTLFEYGTTTSYGNAISDSTLTTSHTITLSNLTPDTTYHFKITSKNFYGLSSSTEDNTFTTKKFSAKTIGDYGNVTVMEVTGNYDAKNPDGTINVIPRQEIAKEFLRTHSDQYDFLVIFSNFDFTMPDAAAKAFYLEIKNDVHGIGKLIFDNSSLFGSNGKLQGMIDMGNILKLVTNPLDTKFEETILTLAHEQMHRWGANIKFKDESGNISTALLGKDGVHWSYLLDTDASVMYGNDWRDNGDGTFTSVATTKYYSSLDLYLMGMYDKSQVVPMLLIDNPAIDPTKMPEVGAKVSGTAKLVTIDNIIAAECERIPDASISQKTFKIAYILLTRPDTYTGNELEGIENIRKAWAGRFRNLTYGKGSIMDVTPSISIFVSSPSDGETVTKSDVMIKGAIINSTGNETGVTVNGIVATVYGNQFVANHVLLVEGVNTITIKATDTDGNTATTSITVNAITTGNYIRITSNIESGIAPLEVILRVDGSFSIEESNLNITGPTQPEIVSSSPDEYTIRIIAEGIYYITANVTGPDDILYEDTIAIVVLNKTQLDRLLRNKWEGMKEALGNKDIEGALNYFHETSKESYRQAFNILINEIPHIISEMQDIEMIYQTDDISKYRINRLHEINGAYHTITYYIYFIKDKQGFWRINKF